MVWVGQLVRPCRVLSFCIAACVVLCLPHYPNESLRSGAYGNLAMALILKYNPLNMRCAMHAKKGTWHVLGSLGGYGASEA
jgi:hypothetical protein